ncbi:MAG: hypothetical protein ACREN4_07290 [Candidatus Dormibacteria bacterium]
MTTPFDGLGLWVFDFLGGGTPLTPADAAAYKAQGVRWFGFKVSDGLTGGGQAIFTSYSAGVNAGLTALPWGFFEPGIDTAQQLQILYQASGEGFPAAICDIESVQTIPSLAGPSAHGMKLGISTWGNPLPTALLDIGHPGAPSIGQLADIGVRAILPQAYGEAWGVTPARAIQIMQAAYAACNLPNMPPLLPTSDQGGEALAFAQAAKAAGYGGVSFWRHGANGVTPAALAGVAALFPPPAPSPPPPPPSPVQLVTGQEYLTPKGDTLVLG